MARPDPLIVLQARADARARLLLEGWYSDIDEAFMPLYEHARESGLMKKIGMDAIDGIVLAALEQAKNT